MSVLVFAKFPPPNTGSTLATKTVADLLSDKARVDRIDTSTGDHRPDTYSLEWAQQRFAFASRLVAAYRSLWRTLRKGNYDTFYFIPSPSLFGHWRTRIATEIARPHVKRVVAHVHSGNFANCFQKIGTSHSAHRMVDLVDTFLFLSRKLSNKTKGYIPSSKRSVVRNTIDKEVYFSDDEVESKIEGKAVGRSLRILFLSKMLKTKGYKDVAKAVASFNSETNETATVDFVGEWKSTQAKHHFEEWVKTHRYSQMMQVHGRIDDRRRIRQILLEADVFVLPTYYPTEAQPISIIEALNAGTPVISTKHASIPEYVHDNKNGYLVDKKSPSQIKDALQELTDYRDWFSKARAARRTYNSMFSHETVRKTIYQSVLAD